MLALRDGLSPEERRVLSKRIFLLLEAQEEYVRSRLPLLYLSFRSEVCTHDLVRGRLANGLPVALPVTDVPSRRIIPYLVTDWDGDLVKGAYGILEPNPNKCAPISPQKIDLVVVPGSVFDRSCGRFGYGGGYYDRFLGLDADHALRIGLAYGIQVVDGLPVAPHDVAMDMVVTENGVIHCRRPEFSEGSGAV